MKGSITPRMIPCLKFMQKACTIFTCALIKQCNQDRMRWNSHIPLTNKEIKQSCSLADIGKIIMKLYFDFCSHCLGLFTVTVLPVELLYQVASIEKTRGDI